MLRVEAGKNPFDRDLWQLIGELSTRSDDFRTWWGAHDVHVYLNGVKRLRHRVVGDLELAHERMDLPSDPGLTIVTFSAEPGSASEDGLKLLSSWSATPAKHPDASGQRRELIPSVPESVGMKRVATDRSIGRI